MLPLGSPEAFGAAYEATSTQLADLQLFHNILDDARSRMNLVGPSAMGEFWQRHAFDSAQLLHVEQSALRWADVGAGAGFPGIVLAILLKAREGACVYLIESMAKRASFLRHVVSTMRLPAEVHHTRAEQFATPAGLEVVTARACAPLPRLLDYTAHFLEQKTTGLFLKGRGVESELTMARRDWAFQSELIPSRSGPDGWIVRVEGLKRHG